MYFFVAQMLLLCFWVLMRCFKLNSAATQRRVVHKSGNKEHLCGKPRRAALILFPLRPELETIAGDKFRAV